MNKINTSASDYIMNRVETNIIVGSLIGDGSLALYGRSINAHYREHGCNKQLPYRKWKQKRLRKLDFKLSHKGNLTSPSHPIYTELYKAFYFNRIKTLTAANLQLLDHPLGLACLYMDDGSLIMDQYSRPNKIQIFPRIALYTLSFSKQENILLMKHIYETFDIKFKPKKHPDGKNVLLEINHRNEIYKFINLIKPYVLEIPEMAYKVDAKGAMEKKYLKLLKNKKDTQRILKSPLQVKDNTYTDEEVRLLLKLKANDATISEIAKELKRSYWGVYDKYRRIKNSL